MTIQPFPVFEPMRGVAKTYARRGFRDHPGHS